MRKFKSVCSLDCWDRCSIEITTDENNIASIAGDTTHPITKGFLCQKGLQHLSQRNSPERITLPMKKVNGQWISLSWENAIAEIGDQLISILNNEGPSSIIHLSDAGHCGLLKNIDKAFFNSLGGTTKSIGSLCWGAGIEAQRLDFGKILSHDPRDHLNSKTIIIWGRNPVFTNVHLVPFLLEAKGRGVNIVVIDPVKTATASICTHYFQIKPQSDGHLALAMAKLIIEKGLLDNIFTTKYCKDFEAYKNTLTELSLSVLVEATGLTLDEVIQLTELYANNKASSIILGYGLQRYPNGGTNIRLIDALAAITGNIGISGGGVNYANQYINQWIDWQYVYNNQTDDSPTFIKANFADYILDERPNEIKAIFITRGNPMVQLPNTEKSLEAYKSIPLKVTIDHFMTDTANNSDYVLPCTHIFEEEDFLFSSMWHSYFNLSERVFEPLGEAKSEFQIFKGLGEYMKLCDFSKKYPDERYYLEKALAPLLNNIGYTLDEIKGKNLKLKGNDIPWENRSFATPSKKFEFIVPSVEFYNSQRDIQAEFPLQLISLHPKHSLHSQHFRTKPDALPTVYCHQHLLDILGIEAGETVKVKSAQGEISCIVEVSQLVSADVIAVYEGWWLKAQGVNKLTPTGYSDIGNQAIYNHCFCRIEKI